MVLSFQQKVRQVAQRARRLVRLYGLGWFVVVVALVGMSAAALDFLIRFEDRGVRLILLSVLCLVTLWGFVRFVMRAWRYRCTDLQAAWRIERSYPALRDRLSHAVAFAGGSWDDQLAGSVEQSTR